MMSSVRYFEPDADHVHYIGAGISQPGHMSRTALESKLREGNLEEEACRVVERALLGRVKFEHSSWSRWFQF